MPAIVVVSAAKFAGEITLFAFDDAEVEQNEERYRRGKKPRAVGLDRKANHDKEERNVNRVSREPVNAFDDDCGSRLVRTWMRLVPDELRDGRDEDRYRDCKQSNGERPSQRVMFRKKREMFIVPADISTADTQQ